MANGEFGIDEKTWAALPVERQLWLIFSEFNRQRIECDQRFCKIKVDHVSLARKFDRRKRVDTTFAGAMGFLGGLIGYLGGKLFK